MYADAEFWLALLSDDDAAAALLEEHAEDLEVSPVTVLQLFLVADEYDLDLEATVTAILSVAEYTGDPDALYRAVDYRRQGLDAFQAFHAAMGEPTVLSGDDAYDAVPVGRVWTE